MTSDQLLDNFKLQKSQVMEEIRTLEQELSQKKELYVKLEGAIEGLELLNSNQKTEEDSSDDQMLNEVLS
jgi:hypothetical protein